MGTKVGLLSHIYVVDDEAMIRRMIKNALDREGFSVLPFENGESFLKSIKAEDAKPGVVLLDLKLPDATGLEVLAEMGGNLRQFPVLIVSSFGDIGTAVEAVRNGALDFIQKPFEMNNLIAKIRSAQNFGEAWESQRLSAIEAKSKVAALTARELEVGRAIAKGASNKEVARQLDLSPRTVEAHRARIMTRLNASSSADVVRLFVLSELET